MRGDINESLGEYGFIKMNFYSDEINAIKSILGTEHNKISDFRVALLNALGVTAHERPKLSAEEKTARQIDKIAEAYGISADKLEQVKKLLKLA